MMHKILTPLALALLASTATAKLPAPNEEAKAKAAETAAKTAHAGKVDNYKLCLAMDKVAAGYLAAAKQAGKPSPVPVATPACGDPGEFVYPPPVAKPIEAAGAHSPTATAASPPNTNAAAATILPKK